jgi:curved DNA-binding protein CbpA
MDYYKILDVTSSASMEEIKKSYFHLARRYHPDIFGQELSSDMRDKIDEVFAAITEAYHTLSDEAKRTDYDSRRETIPREDRRDMAKTAETKFRQGKTLYGMEMYEDSVTLLEEATRLMPEKSTYFLLLAMAEAKIPAFRKRAEQHFLRSIRLDSWNPEGHVGLGLLYKNEGLAVKARKQFERALKVDPDHPIAQKEMSRTDKNDKKKMELKDILSMDIFGKKKKK